MGTRADFYIGFGKNAEWLGSVGWDGYEWATRIDDNDIDDIVGAQDENQFRVAVFEMLKRRSDGTLPSAGWPWPWKSSYLTDYVYYWDNGIQVDTREEQVGWPQMFSEDKNPDLALGRNSGLIVVRGS